MNLLTQRTKNVVHGIQALIIFLAWAVTIAVFTKDGNTDGRTKYFFILCFFCIPALIYQSAVPTFERTKKFANPYASAAVDVILTILWFAAFIAVAVWTNSGVHAGEDDKKNKDKNIKGCAAFAYGTEGKCKLSRVTVGMGVIIFFLFIATSAISVYRVIYFRKNGSLPGNVSHPPDRIEDQTKYAFSSNPHDELDEDAEDHAVRPERHEEDEYALLHTNTEEGTHPGRPLSWGREHAPSQGGFDEADTSYHGGRAHPKPPPHASVEDRFNQLPPPVGTPLYDANHTTFHGADNYSPPQYAAGDPFRDDQAFSHDDSEHAGAERVNFPAGEYHR